MDCDPGIGQPAGAEHRTFKEGIKPLATTWRVAAGEEVVTVLREVTEEDAAFAKEPVAGQ